ncbi:pre-peptidase C-terminal domain-containing protein [Thalassomonas actiniarum]|uniref:Pre-peptidase C-terminal domain-containing protein n=1 Tax=Thalassomonas actiniarum TaxID=485447 RepID=A0AAF0C4C8_9GAMM|nr:pre-peptidase C-terminal domain-containing protein [Thalassomonas actiniarum]WDE02157.1 pre-peptidase C-terminal domain-containing protein [Thalassomonas actiniarum]
MYKGILKYTTIIMALASSTVFSAEPPTSPMSLSSGHTLQAAPQVTMSALDNEALRARDAKRAASASEPVLQFAEPIAVSIKAESDWTALPAIKGQAAYSLWRTKISSPGALSLNLGFKEFYMPEGGALFVYSADGEQMIRPFTSKDNEDHGQLWTPMVSGDTVIIEVNIPSDKQEFLRLELTSVNHGYIGKDIHNVFQESRLLSGSCNVDVVCPAGDDWRRQIRSVAAYSTGGSLFCTGSALNNTANDGKGYFLTADHCGISASNAASLVTYWNFENSYCREPGSGDSGGNGDGQLNQFNTGAIFRAGNSSSDFTLVELDDPFDQSHNVYLSGWNANATLNTSAVGIHHPNVDEKRISFENDNVVRTNYSSSTPNANGTHVQVIDWDLGTTEPGSSGSPLFDQNKRVIGQLHGGSAACGNNSPDWYGALSVSWNNGASNWLDAANTGSLAIDGMEGSGSDPGVPNASFSYNCTDLSCNFDGSGSTDSDGTITGYAWSFGDNGNGSGTNPSHTYGAYGSYTVTLTVTDNDGQQDAVSKTVALADPDQGKLTNGVPVSGLADSTGNEQEFHLVVPADASSVSFNMSGGSGDADLYVRFGAKPTENDYDCRPYAGGNNEDCSFSAQAGTYYVMIRAYSSYSGVSLVGSYQTGGSGDSGSNLDIGLSSKTWFRHTIEVPAGTAKLTVETSGGSGDADLYLRSGSEPTTGSYDCRSWTSSNTESCVINNPAAGTWHVGVHAYSAVSGVDEQWSYQ